MTHLGPQMVHTQLRFLETIDYLFAAGNAWSVLGTYSAMTLPLGYQRLGLAFQKENDLNHDYSYFLVIIPMALSEETAGI